MGVLSSCYQQLNLPVAAQLIVIPKWQLKIQTRVGALVFTHTTPLGRGCWWPCFLQWPSELVNVIGVISVPESQLIIFRDVMLEGVLGGDTEGLLADSWPGEMILDQTRLVTSEKSNCQSTGVGSGSGVSWVGPPNSPLLTGRCSLLHLRTWTWDPTSTPWTSGTKGNLGSGGGCRVLASSSVSSSYWVCLPAPGAEPMFSCPTPHISGHGCLFWSLVLLLLSPW